MTAAQLDDAEGHALVAAIHERKNRNTMSENKHHGRAMSRLHNGTTNEVTRAQAEAALALAYEQRTANLIAAFTHLRDCEGVTLLEDATPLIEQIKQRLSL